MNNTCKCCLKPITTTWTELGSQSFNLDGSEHEKHYRIWAVSVASFINNKLQFIKKDPEEIITNMTYGELEHIIESNIKLKLGTYYQSQTDLREEWLAPKLFTMNGINYYVGGVIDGREDGEVIELKTTWTTKTKMQNVIDKAKTQADLYGWIDDSITEVKIKIVNLAKPNLSTTVHHRTEPGMVPDYLHRYVKDQKSAIKQYNF